MERKLVINAWLRVAGQEAEKQQPAGCGETDVAVEQVNLSLLLTDLHSTGSARLSTNSPASVLLLPRS